MGIKKGSTLTFKRKEQAALKEKGKKGCQRCGTIRPVSYFRKQNTANGYASYCKYCRHVRDCEIYNRELMSEEDFWHMVNKDYDGWERLHIKNIQRKFNISFEYAKELTEVENCYICEKHKDDNGRTLAIDHCHKTGEIRGVLCSLCNTGLGSFRDNVDFLKSAIDYLKKEC